MFFMEAWDSLGELLTELLVVGVLCIILYLWAARVRRQDLQQHQAASPPTARPPGGLSPSADSPPPASALVVAPDHAGNDFPS